MSKDYILLELTARVEDRSTQEEIKDAAATYAGRFFILFSDSEFQEECLHELQKTGEHLNLIVVAVL